jgi:hypothetical protein
MTPKTQAPTSDAQAVPAEANVSPRTVSTGSNWRQETRISNDMEPEEYDASVSDRWGQKRIKLNDDDPAQDEEQNNAVQPEVKDGEGDEEMQAVPNDANPSSDDGEHYYEDSSETEEGDPRDEDPDAITPAPPLIPPHMIIVNDCTTLVDIKPRGTLIMTDSLQLLDGSNTIVPAHVTFVHHPHIPDGLSLRFLQPGARITDDEIDMAHAYELPRELYESRSILNRFVREVAKYRRRHENGAGCFGDLEA